MIHAVQPNADLYACRIAAKTFASMLVSLQLQYGFRTAERLPRESGIKAW